MKELLALIRKSKTAKAGIVTIVWGILLMFGVGNQDAPETIDDMNNPPSDLTRIVMSVGAALAGGMTIKGRNDVEKRIKETENG